VHDVDFEEEDAAGTARGDCVRNTVPPQLSETDEGINNGENIREPFSGDLQLISERDDATVFSPVVTRKRRKLPEIPKNPPRRCIFYIVCFYAKSLCLTLLSLSIYRE